MCSDHFHAKDFVEAERRNRVPKDTAEARFTSSDRQSYRIHGGPKFTSANRERSVRVVAEAPSNLVHQIFVDIDENPFDIEENPVHIIPVRAELNEDQQQDNMNNGELQYDLDMISCLDDTSDSETSEGEDDMFVMDSEDEVDQDLSDEEGVNLAEIV